MQTSGSTPNLELRAQSVIVPSKQMRGDMQLRPSSSGPAPLPASPGHRRARSVDRARLRSSEEFDGADVSASEQPMSRKGSVKRSTTAGSLVNAADTEDDNSCPSERSLLLSPATPAAIYRPLNTDLARLSSTGTTPSPTGPAIGRVQQRNEDLRQTFGLPSNEAYLIDEWNCAYKTSNNILLQGRIFLFNNFLCFHSNVFGVNKKIIMSLQNIVSIRKRKHVGVIPNSMEVTHGGRRLFFTSFLNRDEAFWTICTQWGRCKSELSEAHQLNTSKSGSGRPTMPPQSGTKADDRRISTDNEDEDEDEDSRDFDLDNDMADVEVEWSPRPESAPPVAPEFTEVVKDELPCTPHQFFIRFLQNSSTFTQDAMSERGDRDIQKTDWTQHSTLGCLRNITFVSPVKSSFGPPETRCFQSQRYNVFAGNHLRLETSQVMQDIPYGDHFTVETCWDVIESGPAGCQLKVSICVAFSRKTVFRSTIEKGTVTECTAAFKAWVVKARQALQEPVMHRRSLSGQRSLPAPSPEGSPHQEKKRWPKRESVDGGEVPPRKGPLVGCLKTSSDRLQLSSPRALPATQTQSASAVSLPGLVPHAQPAILLVQLLLLLLVAVSLVVFGAIAARFVEGSLWRSHSDGQVELQLQVQALKQQMTALQAQLADLARGLDGACNAAGAPGGASP